MKGISVIICTFNGAQRMLPVLEALELQTGEFSLELIVVDNASTDGISDLVNARLVNSKLNWKVVQESQPGLSHARLAGIKESTFDFLLFCDDDNALFPDYLITGYSLLEGYPQIGVLGGEGIPQFSSPKPDWFEKYCSSYAVGPQGKVRGKVSAERGFVYGAGSFFRKAPLLELLNSGFQPYFTGRKQNNLSAGDDVELCLLLQLKGFEIWFDPALKFHHLIPERRLTWDYYLQMKAGISAGAAVFFSYEHFLKSETKSGLGFAISYFKYLMFYQLILLKNIAFGYGSLDSPDQQLARLILKVKAKAFRIGFKESLRHFTQLKSKF